MTDEQIAEIYSLARDSLRGRPSFQVQAYPFRMTPANLARHRTNPHLAFWKMLKIGNRVILLLRKMTPDARSGRVRKTASSVRFRLALRRCAATQPIRDLGPRHLSRFGS